MRFKYSSSFFPGLRRHIPMVIAIIAGLAVALASAKYMLVYVNTHKETVKVPVPARDISPYTTISSEDIVWREIVKGGEDPGAIRDPSEAVGKLTIAPLYRNEQIRKERLTDPNLVAGKQIISINVDVARSVGGALKAGDLVDVWWVLDPALPNWSLAAVDAVVLDMRDSSGRSVLPAGGGIVQQTFGSVAPVQSNPPAVAVLAVRSEEVSRVVGGASPKSQNAVLAKKFMPTPHVSAAAEPIDPNQKNQGPKTAALKTNTAERR